MTVKTLVDTEALEPGDLVAHMEVPERMATGRVVRSDDEGSLVVVWSHTIETTAVPSNRLRLIDRPEACAIVDVHSYAGCPDPQMRSYTFVVTGNSDDVREDVGIYQDAPGHTVVSFRLGRERAGEDNPES